MTNQINFKKAFIIFFAAFGLFALTGILMGAWAGFADSRLLERLMLTGFRARLFTDPLVAFRSIAYLFLAAFHVLLALWVYADCYKSGGKKGLWFVFTAITGPIAWLIYMIRRNDAIKIQPYEEV